MVRILLWRWNQLVGGMMGRPKTICFVQPWLAGYGSLGDKIYIFACFCFYLRPLLIFGSANVKTELSAYANQERGSKYGHALEIDMNCKTGLEVFSETKVWNKNVFFIHYYFSFDRICHWQWFLKYQKRARSMFDNKVFFSCPKYTMEKLEEFIRRKW